MPPRLVVYAFVVFLLAGLLGEIGTREALGAATGLVLWLLVLLVVDAVRRGRQE